MLKIDVAELKRPIQTLPESGFCGDETLVIDDSSSIFLAVFDGAGHGYGAHKAAEMAIHFLKQEAEKELCTLLLSLDHILRGTRGGVASLCRIDKKTGGLECTGIGNISIRLFKPASMRFVTRGGVLGNEITHPKLERTQLNAGNVLMLYSDGVKDHFEPDDFPDFFTLSAYDIARITIDYFSKTLDDASIVVVKVNDD